MGGGMEWLGDGHLMGWALGVILCVGKSNSNKNMQKNKGGEEIRLFTHSWDSSWLACFPKNQCNFALSRRL